MDWYIKLGVIFALVVLSVTTLIGRLEADFNRYQEAKGIALSDYLAYYQNIEVPPAQAKYFNVQVSQYDIQIDSLDVFGSWNNDGK